MCINWWQFFFFFLHLFLLFCFCFCRAQSCTLMIIPLTHYDDFATHFFFRSGKYVSQPPSFTPPPPPPPPQSLFFACPHSQRARVSELKSISSKLLIWISRTAGETPLGIGLVLSKDLIAALEKWDCHEAQWLSTCYWLQTEIHICHRLLCLQVICKYFLLHC